MPTEDVRIKRIYDEAEASDGARVLVDRLWPRGVSRERADLDEWLKDVAPSPQLREWWDHDPARLEEFATRYRAELAGNPALDELLRIVREHPVTTLLYAAHDPAVNHAVVLQAVVRERLA